MVSRELECPKVTYHRERLEDAIGSDYQQVVGGCRKSSYGRRMPSKVKLQCLHLPALVGAEASYRPPHFRPHPSWSVFPCPPGQRGLSEVKVTSHHSLLKPTSLRHSLHLEQNLHRDHRDLMGPVAFKTEMERRVDTHEIYWGRFRRKGRKQNYREPLICAGLTLVEADGEGRVGEKGPLHSEKSGTDCSIRVCLFLWPCPGNAAP